MTETKTAVYSHYNFYVPAFEVKIKGQSLDREVIRDVISVTYSDSLDKLDTCQITLNNWDAERREFKYLDQTDYTAPVNFDPGGQIELYMGYYDRGGLTLMLRGTITGQTPDFPAGGQPTIQISALNNLYRLHFKQEVEVFKNKTDSAIARAVLDKINDAHPDLNLSLAPHPAHLIEFPHDYIVLNNEYPIIFLMQQARHNGYALWLDEIKTGDRTQSFLHFEPADLRNQAAYELVWGQSLIGFKPTLKTKNQVAKITVRGWNPDTKAQISGEATWDDLDFQGLPSTEEMSAVDSALAGSEEIVADEPIYTEDEARQKAKDHLTRLAKDLVSGSGQTVGLPELRAGRPVYIRGLGKRFSGRYMVASTTHTIDGNGYLTSFEARMEEPK
jgi:uncharacterized protein